MPDILGFSPDGSPISVPQETAATWYRDGKLKFKQGTPVPVKVRGTEGTLPAEDLDAALAAGETELNFDPHGAAKAAAAGALDSATLGASTWLAVEGQKLIDPEGAEKTRQALQGLRDEHGVAWAGGQLGGAIIPALVPGGAEADLLRGGAVGAEEAARASQGLGAANEALAAKGAIEEGAQATKALADAQAAAGATKGSQLARTFRAVNPYEHVGRAGQLVEHLVGGQDRFGRIAGPMARFATEGALIGAADAVDESELGDTNLTGEAILAGMEHGALWGTGFGLVGSGVARITTAAGRMADRLAEAQLGGSPLEMRTALKQHGPGTLGSRWLEEGGSPLLSPEQKYDLAAEMHNRDGQTLERVVRDADHAYVGVNAQEVEQAFNSNVNKAVEKYALAGGNPDAMLGTLQREVRLGLGLREPPTPPELIPSSRADDLYEAGWKQAGLPPPEELKKPRAPSEEQVDRLTQKYARQQGLSQAITAQDIQARVVREIEQAKLEKRAIAPWVFSNQGKEILMGERARQIEGLKIRARSDLFTPYTAEMEKFQELNEAHLKLQAESVEQVRAANAENERTYQRTLEAVEKYNKELEVGFSQVREVRKRIDGVIPWNYAHSASAIDNAANEIRLAARSAIEGKVEEGLDKAAREAGDPSILGQYLHAKARYAQSADILKMTERLRARHAGLYGRPSRVGGIGAHVALGAIELASGHPLAAAALGIGGGIVRHYGPGVAAWAMHKASRVARLKALRQEIQIGGRRGVRATLGQGVGAEKPVHAPPVDEAAVQKELRRGDLKFAYVPIKNIARNTDTWSPEKLEALRSKVGQTPIEPIRLSATDDGRLSVDDGIHRLAVAKERGFTHVGAVLYPEAVTALERATGVKPTAKVAMKDMSPAETRLTAAQAMEQVSRLGGNLADLRGRLAALDPSLPVVAPQSFAAAEGAFRRQVTWLASQIPPKLASKLQTDGSINPRDISDADAREFLDHAMSTIDPRVATDAAAQGKLSAAFAKSHRAAWPSINKAMMLDYKRMVAMDKENMDFLPVGRKSHLDMLFRDSDPGFTLRLQSSSAITTWQTPPPGAGPSGGPKGMSHAAATSKGMESSVNLMATIGQTAESGPPGRRGRSGRTADSGL